MKLVIFTLILSFSVLANSYTHECVVLMQAESFCEIGKKNTGKEENLHSYQVPGSEKKLGFTTDSKEDVELEDEDDNPIETKKRIAKKTGAESQVTKNLLVACGPLTCRDDLVQEFDYRMGQKISAVATFLKTDSLWKTDTKEKFVSRFPQHLEKALNDVTVNVLSAPGAKRLLNELDKAKGTLKVYGKSLSKDQYSSVRGKVAAMLVEKDKAQWKIPDDLLRDLVVLQRKSLQECHVGWTHWNQANSYSDYEPAVEILPATPEKVELVVELDAKENKCGLTPESKKALETHHLNLNADAICSQVRAKCKSPTKPAGTVKAGFEIMKEIDVNKALEDAPLKGGEPVLLSETGRQLKLYNSTCEVLGIGKPVYVLEATMDDKGRQRFLAEYDKGRIRSLGQEMKVTCE